MPSHRTRPRKPFVTPPEQSPRRHAVERRLALWVSYLAQLPRWVPWVIVAVVFLAGAFAPGAAGAAALLAIVMGLAALAFVTWPSLHPPARLLRAAVLAVLVFWAVTKLR